MNTSRVRVVWPAVLVLAACSEPFGPFSGGELTGRRAAPPARWSDVPDVVQLEVRPSDPYSVNVWSVGIGADLYVATREEGDWVAHLQSDAGVRLRMDGAVYALRAAAVQDAAERQRVVEAYLRKYAVDEDDGFIQRARRRRFVERLDSLLADGFFFRLDRR